MPPTLFCRDPFRSNTFAGIAPRGHSAMQKEVRMKIEQSTEAGLTSAQQLLNKRSKTRTQTNKIQATRGSESLKLVFLDAITHDFKTPLTSIKASVTGLLDDLETDREQRKELLTIIDEECDRINQLVSEASEIARLESGEVKLDLGSYSVEELISAALADCKGATSNREICLDVKHLDSRLLVDLTLAKRVLVHLITNAQLYSSPGQPIRITTKKHDKFHIISLGDQGPGIEAEEIDHIFKAFYRGKNQRHRAQGTGMGLPIAKTIVEAHGGTIRVVSCVGQGSVFTFSLPAER
jgi:two-component system, OmpR family, sensor histidine kinase KdpD